MALEEGYVGLRYAFPGRHPRQPVGHRKALKNIYRRRKITGHDGAVHSPIKSLKYHK